MIGYQPQTEDLFIVNGQDLFHEFETTLDAPWPADTELALYVYNRDETRTLGLWPAVDVTPEIITLQIPSPDLKPMPDGGRFRVFVTYPGHPTLCMYTGRIWRI